METNNEKSPYLYDNIVDYFLEYARNEDGSYRKGYGGLFIEQVSPEKFQNFCKELEMLREMSKVVTNYMKYLKTKNEQ